MLLEKFKLLNSLTSREQVGSMCLIRKEPGEDMFTSIRIPESGALGPARSTERAGLNLGVMSSSPTLRLGQISKHKKICMKKIFPQLGKNLPVPVVTATRLSEPASAASWQQPGNPCLPQRWKRRPPDRTADGKAWERSGKSLGQEA